MSGAAAAIAVALMDAITAGPYQPANMPDEPPTPVAAFRIDRRAVTNGEFLRFVREDLRWRRGSVSGLFADEGYLTHWAGPLALGPRAPEDAPVVHVSWFAARAFCKARGAHMPSEAQWERALAASAPDDARRDACWQEWVRDFNATLSSADSRSPGTEATCGAGAGARDPAEYAAFMRVAYRSSLKARYTTANLGFRCAVEEEGP